MARSQINIRLNSTTGRQIAELAATTGMSKTSIITVAVDRYYKEEREMEHTERNARQRVENTPELKAAEGLIFHDWPNWDEHMVWIATAPVAEIVDWVEAVEAAGGQVYDPED